MIDTSIKGLGLITLLEDSAADGTERGLSQAGGRGNAEAVRRDRTFGHGGVKETGVLSVEGDEQGDSLRLCICLHSSMRPVRGFIRTHVRRLTPYRPTARPVQ